MSLLYLYRLQQRLANGNQAKEKCEMNRPILVYARYYLWKVYSPLFNNLMRFRTIFLTDFPRNGIQGLSQTFHLMLSKGNLASTGFDEEDIIARCRLLRNLNPDLARGMIRAMYATLKSIVEDHTPVIIVGQTVDDYTTHLLALLAKQYGIPYLGLTGSYFPGYSQVTCGIHGQPVLGYQPTDREVEEALTHVGSSDFRQNYLQPVRYNRTIHAKRVMRYWLKQAAFGVLRRIRRTPWHYHYIVQPYTAQQKRLMDFPTEKSFSKHWEREILSNSRKRVYLPLSYTPECSNDYWVRNQHIIEYEDTILQACIILAKEHTVIVKEHCHMSGIRNKSFYRKLRDIPNVVSVPPETNSNFLVEKYADQVIVGGGSPGLEATLRRKPVYSYCETSYWFKPSGAVLLDAGNPKSWSAALHTVPSEVDAHEFVRSCLQTMLPFDFFSQPYCKAEEVKALDTFLDRVYSTKEGLL